MELGRADAEDVRVAAHLVQAGQPRPAVEGGVLHPLGQHRPRGLAEPDDQLVARGLPRLVARDAAQAQHPRAHRVQRQVQPGLQDLAGRGRGGGHDGHRDLGRRLARPHVGPVYAERGQQLDQHVVQVGLAEPGQGREVGPGEQPGQPVQLRAERGVGDAALGVPGHLGEVRLAAGQPDVVLGQPGRAVRVHEQPVDQGQRVVAGGARAVPGRQLLTAGQDLLHHDPHAAGRAGQPPQVAARVGQPVRVVHPQAVDQALGGQPQRHPVRGLEHVGVLGPDGDERVDVEEPAPVELGGRVVPVGQQVVLLGEQHAQRQVGDAVPQRQHVIEVAQHRTAVLGVLRGLGRGVDDEVVQALLQRPGQDRHEQLAVLRRPVDVEPVRVRRGPALVQHRPQLLVA